MRKILTIIFTLFLYFNFVGCVSTNVPTQIIDIDENPDSEFVINAMWLKEPIKVKFVLEKATGSGATYKAERTETLGVFTINPKDKVKIRFNSKEHADKLFIGESDFNTMGIRFSTNWGQIGDCGWLKGKSRVIVLTKNGRCYSRNNKTYKEIK